MNRDRDERGRFKPGNRQGRKFTTNKQPKNPGRKPTLYKQIKRETAKVGEEIGRKEFYDIMLYLLSLTATELKNLAETPDVPIWIVAVISAIFEDVRSGNLRTVNSIFDRCFGKPGKETQTVIVNQNVEKIENYININLNVLTQNEIIILNNILNREMEQIDDLLDDNSKHPSMKQINELVESEIARIEGRKLSRKEGKRQEK